MTPLVGAGNVPVQPEFEVNLDCVKFRAISPNDGRSTINVNVASRLDPVPNSNYHLR